jgi:hypothetical protein
MAGIDDDVRARLERRCEQALSEGGGEPGSGAASLAQWRGAVSGGGAALGASNPSRAADEPRELVELVKGELLARRQEELLSIIRETPGWGQSNIGKTGYLHVHDAPSRSGRAHLDRQLWSAAALNWWCGACRAQFRGCGPRIERIYQTLCGGRRVLW